MITITPVNFKSYKSNSKKNSIKNVSFEANAVKEVVKKARAIDPELGELLNNLRGLDVSFVVRNCIPKFMTYFESSAKRTPSAIQVSKEFLEEMKKERIHHNLIDGVKKFNQQGEFTGEVYTGLEKAIQIISSR